MPFELVCVRHFSFMLFFLGVYIPLEESREFFFDLFRRKRLPYVPPAPSSTASSTLVWLPSVVTIITGTFIHVSLALRCVQNSRPSIFGILISERIKPTVRPQRR